MISQVGRCMSSSMIRKLSILQKKLKLKNYLVVSSDNPKKAMILAQTDTESEAMDHKIGGFVISSFEFIYDRYFKTCDKCCGDGVIAKRVR